MVFHLITNRQNFYAMKLWFARNPYNEAVIHVLNIEDLNQSLLNGLGLKQFSASEEFRISVPGFDQTEFLQLRTEYVSIFGHSHFLLPEIFKNLKKVIVLDDDVIVQQDLSSLWNIDLEGKVNGAVNFCKLQLGQLEIIHKSIEPDRNIDMNNQK
ncbi:putative galacturonosyltransferase 7 [Dendrobium catenatum]|uniref:Hexosyltransferase n=1 Tax=Dendrobium catenatum TaxID=906689 RepID=A0A2I0VGT7_9ASPA|nr:putative galacturonosyltransferase 7 [Dendrobium catenatum]